MEYLICTIPVMPLRAEPDDRSEMVSQLIFGEAAILLERGKGNWIRIQNQFDAYTGWTSIKQMEHIKEHLYNTPTKKYSSEYCFPVQSGGHPMNLPMGSFLKGIHHRKMKWGRLKTVYKGSAIQPDVEEISEKKVRELAFQFLNTPYLWGGRSNYGIDCSGFTQTLYRLLGKRLARDTGEQAKQGELLDEDAQLKCGDLAFFHNQEGKISHVGIMMNHFEIIHASGKVRIDKLDNQGIIYSKTGEYSHQLSFIRRLF